MDEKNCKKSSEPETVGMGCRMSARAVLKDSAKHQERKAEALTILLKVIPWELLSAHDEEVLWNFFCERR